MMKEENSITKFIGDILQITLAVIVIGVIVSMARAKEKGEHLNPVEAGAKMAHQFWIDLKTGWSDVNKNDTIK